VRFEFSDIKNLDDVCKKIHTGNTGVIMPYCFHDNKFTGILDISHWEISPGYSLSFAFRRFPAQKIILHPKFDLMVSSVRYFRYCWSETLNVPNIQNWKINGDTNDFRNCFYNTKNFNQDLSTKNVERHGITYTAWDVSGGGNFSSMFYGADKFNRDLTSWDVSNVNSFSYMFGASNFNGDISNWNISNANDLSGMFQSNPKFNQDISTKIITGTNAETNPSYIAWDTQNATTIKRIFGGALSGRKEIGNNLSIENWNLDKVRDIGELFFANKGNNDGSTIDLRTKIVILDNSSETDDEELKIRKVYIAWNTNTVTSASGTFYYTKTPNIQIDNWNVSNVQNLDTFLQTSDFNPDITKKSVNLLGFSDGYGSDDEETKTDQDKILEQLSDEEKQQLKGDDTSNPLTEYTAWYTLSVNSMTYFADYNDSFDRNLSDWCLKSMTSFPGQRDNTNNWRDKLNLENIGKDCTE
jgi:surface protein